jgi:hypothetical protein
VTCQEEYWIKAFELPFFALIQLVKGDGMLNIAAM